VITISAASIGDKDISYLSSVGIAGASAFTHLHGGGGYVSVSGSFYYIDDTNNKIMPPIGAATADSMAAVISMSLPSGNYRSYKIDSYHTAKYANESWSATRTAYY